MSKIEYLTWDPDNGYDEDASADSACATLEKIMDDYAALAVDEGWPDMISFTAAYAAVPIQVVVHKTIARREDYESDEAWVEAGYSTEFDEYDKYEVTDANRGLLAIIEERQRQRAKGYDAAHDAGHAPDELTRAAFCKLAVVTLGYDTARHLYRELWPWPDVAFGGKSDRAEHRPHLLAEVGALCAAAIDAANADKGEE